MMRIGIDLGGTKIEAAALEGGRIVLRRRVATPRNYEGTIEAIASLVADVEAELGRRGAVGIGIPGAVSPATGLIKNANSVWLNGAPLAGDLEKALGRPVRLANDANCFALSEAQDGAATGVEVVFGAILGTGVGGGIVVNGSVLSGANAVSGEWGHNALPWPMTEEQPGPPCYCGKLGCIETFLSGPGMMLDYGSAAGETLQPAEIVLRAESGEPAAEACLRRYESRLARSLASLINVLDPQAIVLGGGMSNIERLYRNVPKLWAPFVFSDRVDTRLLPPLHGDSSGVRGAAWLWPE
jgi:fructokinase